MLDFHIARHQIEQVMTRQFRETPEPDRPAIERTGVITATRVRLSAALHTLASAIEPASMASVGAPNLKH